MIKKCSMKPHSVRMAAPVMLAAGPVAFGLAPQGIHAPDSAQQADAPS